MISNCGHDENGRYSGGKAGDQTGSEISVTKYRNHPWSKVFRYNGSAPSNGSGTINNTTTSTKNNYYNSSASYQGQATYRNTCGYNVNIRTGVGTNNRSIGVVPNGQSVYINQTQGNWGYGRYGGKTGWLKLHYATPCGSSKGLSFSEDENNF